jgi:pimeloyl-ACP methyl ester carboxylesterase
MSERNAKLLLEDILSSANKIANYMNQISRWIVSIIVVSIFLYGQCAYASVKIDTTEIVEINGIKHFITIKGADSHNPVILFFHGGPGRSLMPYAEGFTKRLEEKFVVVQWDQRETGETLKLNSSPEKVTVDLLKSDALGMVKYLLKEFKHKKLYLVSHSWGSVMGFDIAYKHPELLYAYIPISPVVDAQKGAVLTVDYLKKWAEEVKNDTAINELAKVKAPFETEDDVFYTQKWLFIHNEVDGVKGEGFRHIYYKWLDSWFSVLQENAGTNLFTSAPKLECPVYFFEGTGDNQTFYTIARDYFTVLKAKKKQLVWFEKSGHTIFNSEPEKMEQVLLEQVLPETFQ